MKQRYLLPVSPTAGTPTRRCGAPGCTTPYRDKGWCHRHAEKIRRSGTLAAISDKPRKPGLDVFFAVERPAGTADTGQCVVSKCVKRVTARGLCNNHYMKQRRTGTLMPMRRRSGSAFGHGRYHLWSRYRLTPQMYAELWTAQGERCATCGATHNGKRRMSVDHDHETGLVRGLLCVRCNSLVALIEDRGEAVIDAMRAYLDKHGVLVRLASRAVALGIQPDATKSAAGAE